MGRLDQVIRNVLRWTEPASRQLDMPKDTEALERGTAAFMAGCPRTGNPYDPSSEEWMCWRDGWEQARSAADATGGPPVGGERTGG